MKYQVKTLVPNAAGIYKAPQGWRIHSIVFAIPGIKGELRVLLEQVDES